MLMQTMKIAIIGGGASGMVCAIEAAINAKKLNKSVEITIFEKNARLGKKLLATGNGRCNLTNLNCSLENYFGDKMLIKEVLSAFSVQDNIDFFESMGLFCKADSEGRVYPLSNQASGVLDCLIRAIERYRINVVNDCCVNNVKKYKNGFLINEKLFFNKIVIACGGKAAVKENNGYFLLESLGHKICDTAPSLVRLVTDSKLPTQLKGIRASVCIKLKSGERIIAEESGELLFSDNSLSGIVSMQLSPYVSRHFLSSRSRLTATVDFVPSLDFNSLADKLSVLYNSFKNDSTEILLSGFMPKKIGNCILKENGISIHDTVGTVSFSKIKKLVSSCKNFEFNITGTNSYSDAQVTIGGAQTNEFNLKTLESKKQKGLYCCGEIINIDALCGGFNLQWAWSSGRLCGKSIIQER